jgi:GT2 family glycosyltransferase
LDKIFFSVILPVRSINNYIRENVQTFQRLDYATWEILIVTNEVEKSEWDDPRVILLSSGRVSPAIKRNLAADLAKGEVLLFLDDDSYPSQDLLDCYNAVFKSREVLCAGGPGITPGEDGFFAQVSGAFFESVFLGGNPARYRPIGESKRVEDWPSVNLAVEKKVFESVSGFNSEYWPGEDSAFCRTLMLAGVEIHYVPNALVYHHRRNSLVEHLKQVSGYGYHRGFFARKLPENSRKLKYFLPTIQSYLSIFLGVALLIRPHTFFWPALIALVPYLISLLLGFFDTLRRRNIRFALIVVPLAVASHLVYGTRFARGYLSVSKITSKLR